MEYFVLTNNPLVRERLAHEAEVAFVSGGIGDVFERAARYVADGHRLLTHPLSGSVKPGETPYKSMLLSAKAARDMDVASARLISHAIAACEKFVDRSGSYSEQILHDLQLVDLSLIEGARESARM